MSSKPLLWQGRRVGWKDGLRDALNSNFYIYIYIYIYTKIYCYNYMNYIIYYKYEYQKTSSMQQVGYPQNPTSECARHLQTPSVPPMGDEAHANPRANGPLVQPTVQLMVAMGPHAWVYATWT